MSPLHGDAPFAAGTLSTGNEAAFVVATTKRWSEHGWIRRLDSAFGSFVLDVCPQASSTVVLAAVLVTHIEGQGHTCLQVDGLLEQVEDLLGWPAAAVSELGGLLDRLPDTLDEWLGALSSSDVVWVETDGQAADDSQPLVLCGSKIYLRRYWGYERHVAAQLRLRGAMHDPVDEEAACRWLGLLFAPPTPQTQSASQAAFPGVVAPPVDWQKVACAIALRSRISIITGGPGTGKTYCAARLLVLLWAVDPARQSLRIALAAPTGKAATRLQQSIEASLADLEEQLGDALPLRELVSNIGAARTLHALLGARSETRSFARNAAHPLDVDVLIVDEASMIDLEMMAALLDALAAGARLIFLGDKDQLASVEAGAVLGDLCQDAEQGHYTPSTARFVQAVTGQALPAEFATNRAASLSALSQQTVVLRESRRFNGPIGQLALAVNRGDAKAAFGLLNARRSPTQERPLQWIEANSPSVVVGLTVDGRAGAQGGYRNYLDAVRRRPQDNDPVRHLAWAHEVLTAFERFRVLCAVREGDWGVAGLNRAIENALATEGLLSRRGEWYEGRPVMATRNDYDVGIFNGDVAIALKAVAMPGTPPGAALRAYMLDGRTVRSVAVSRLPNVETAFAMTVHKAQGSEFEHVALVLPQEGSRVLTRELVYTGITRARKAFTLVAARPATFTEALDRRTRRYSGLPELL